MPVSGCPSDFTLISRNDNGFVFGTQVTGSAYTTGAPMNAGSGNPCGLTQPPATSSVASILGRAEQPERTFTRRWARSLQTTTAAAAMRTAARSAFGRAPMAATLGLYGRFCRRFSQELQAQHSATGRLSAELVRSGSRG